jgi:hypothetical protein
MSSIGNDNESYLFRILITAVYATIQGMRALAEEDRTDADQWRRTQQCLLDAYESMCATTGMMTPGDWPKDLTELEDRLISILLGVR